MNERLKISADTGAEHANSDLRLQVDGSTKTLIDSNGDIFIGTTTDIAPSNGTNLLWWVMIIHTSIVDALRAMGFVLVISMIYDIVEDSQISTGRRDEGVFMSGPNLIQKILSGFGIFILGIVMQIIGFDSSNMTTEEIQNPIKNLVIFQSVIGPVLSLAGIICLFFYNITRDKFDNTISDLGYKENYCFFQFLTKIQVKINPTLPIF